MSNDVLITPASRKIEFKDSSANVDAKIETDASGNLVITNTGGDISIGDTTSDIFVGDGTNNIDIVFEQDGEIRGTSGVTITLGQSDSNIRMATDLNLNSNDITNVNDLTVAGNLTVSGTTTTVNSTNTTIADSIIELNSGLTGANTKDIGFIFERGSTGNNAGFVWDESAGRFIVFTTTDTAASDTVNTSSVANFQAGSFYGNGANLTSLNATNISSGTLANARLPDLTVSDFAGSAIQTGSESFSDSDTILMTAAAVQDKILSYGYTTNTGTVSSLSDLSITSTAAELNKLDGYTGSVTELNYLDTLHATGVTSTEFDYLDGVTSNIQTQLDGKQASGSYLTGNQTITLSGDVSGSGTTSIAVTVADDSHNHIISNVDGLQTALDSKYQSGDNVSLGTISSGAITSSGNLTVNSALLRILNTGGQSDLRFESANNSFSQILFGDSDGTSRGTIRYKHDTDSFFIAVDGITSSDLEITSSAVNVTGGNLQIGGTTIVDSSRNLTNIGTISSGVITADDGLYATGIWANNNAPATDDAIYSGYGAIGNRSNYYITNANASGQIVMGISGGHNANPKLTVTTSGITVAGNITVSGTVDGRDVATDGTKLDTIATNADVTPSWVPSSNPNYLTGNQTITLSGDVSGSGTTSIAVTIADDSHNHVISNVDGLQTALDAKASLSGATFTGAITATTVNTGQGATEVHLMNQNVRTSDSPTFADLTVTGNLSITGDINSYNVTDLDVTDKTITVGAGQTEANSGGSGLIVDGSGASLLWDESDNYWAMNKSLAFDDTVTTTNQALGIKWTGFDKEGTTDFTDSASIVHTVNTGGHSGSVLLIQSQNDSGDGIAFVTNASSYLKHNSSNILTAANAFGQLGITSTAAELNVLDGYTGSVTELNYLDTLHATGVTSTEFDYLDGVTSNIQTQLNGKQPSGSYLTGNQTITLSGDVSGSGTTSISVTVADDSHNHIISNVDGLQTALDAKLASSSYTASDVLTKIKTVDGAGSGLDADLLDGQHGSYYAPLVNPVFSNNITVRDDITVGNYSTTDTGSLILTGSTANKQAILKCTNGNLHIDSNSGNTMYLNYYSGSGFAFGGGATNVVAWMGSDGDLWKGSADNTGSKYWHAGNDGSGSGLDADTLDGQHASAFLTGNQTITLSGDVSGSGTTSINVTVADDSHNHVISNVDGLQTALDAKLASSSYTAADVLTKIKTVDGAGSGLDADLLDGISSASFWRSDTSNDGAIRFNTTEYDFTSSYNPSEQGVPNSIRLWDHYTQTNAPATYGQLLDLYGRSGHWRHQFHMLGTDLRFRYGTYPLATAGWSSWYTQWHSGNDGSGSGLDADLLDGQHGSYYAPIASPSFTTKITTPQIHHTGVISVLNGSSAQGMKVASLYVGTSYNNSAASGQVNTLNGYRVQGTEVINSSGNWVGGGNISEFTNNSGYITGNQTITLSGDVSGSGTTSINVTVADDSHTHDGRYFTETEADARFINVTGDTATGIHEVDGRWHFNPSTNSSYREGIRLNRSTTGWGGAVFGGVRDSIDGITEAWWVARNPSKNLVLSYATSADNGGLVLTHNTTTMTYKSQRVFMDDYHPNADKWTTARTLSLTGDVTGSVSWDGSGNASITTVVADDSHNHVISNVDGLQTALDGKLSTTGTAANSQLLDSLDSTQFLRSDTADSYSDIRASGSTNTGRFISSNTWGTTHYTDDGYIQFGPANSSYAHIYTDRGNFYFNVTALYASGNTMWHAGNDGSGSGLDADSLDGYNPEEGAVNNSIVKRDGTASIKAHGISLMRQSTPTTGISWYNESYYNWQDYMASAGTTSCGPNGNLTAPTGLAGVTSWALRSRMEGVASYGWNWETGGSGGGGATATSKMSLNATTGNLQIAGAFTAGGDVTAFSDKKLKDNIEVIENAVDKVKQIRGVTFTRNDLENQKRHAGVIAQEVEKVLPEVVEYNKDTDTKTVAYGNMVGLLVEAIKEQQETIDKLTSRINDLEKGE